ncbi:MAG: MMPL family transporter [Ktedonobacterales bacterium]
MRQRPQQGQRPTPTPAASEADLEAHGLYRFGLAYGRRVYRLRWLILALWALTFLAAAPFAVRLPSVLTGGGYTFNNSDSVKVQTIAERQLHQPVAQVSVVFQSATTPASDPAFQAEVQRFAARAQSFAHVSGVMPGITGQDGRTVLVAVNFNEDADHLEQHLAAFRTLIPSSGAATPARAYITGDVAVYDEFNSIAQQDTEKADGAALPIALIVLLVVFGTLAAAFIPVLLALVAIPVALAAIYVIALHTETGIAVLSIASVIGIGISIDYSLFLVRRFREELGRGRAVPDAIGWTVATAGEAIFFSALTVMVGFVGLLLLGIPVLSSFGVGGVLVVAAALLGALTLVPALLSVLGTRINALRLPLIGRITAAGRGETGAESGGFWHRWALGVMRRPVLIIAGVAVVLVALGWPITQLAIGIPSVSSLPASSEARQGAEIIAQQYPETTRPSIYIIAQTPDGSSVLAPDNLARIEALTAWLARQPHVSGVVSLTHLPDEPQLSAPQLSALYASGAYQQNPVLAQFVAQNAAGGTTLLTAVSDTRLDSVAGKQQIIDLRHGDTAAADGLRVYVGGFQAISLDFNGYLYGNFPRTILFVLLVTFLLLLLMFRSLLLPLKAVLVNVLSISAAYGVLVWVFQWGNLQHLLGYTSEGFVETTVPVILFCILFGLSMDYEVFLLSRIREEWLRTGNNRYAVARGLEKTAGVITNAALIFTIVTAALTFTTLITTKEVGLGMTVAILVDATIIRCLLVPAAMRLLGRWNWWLPGRPVPAKQGS